MYHVVTSFNTKIWQKYASNTVGTFIDEYKDKPEDGFKFVYWMDSLEELETFAAEMNFDPDNYVLSSLDQVPHFVDFSRRFDGNVPFNDRGIDIDKIPEGMKFRYNYMPFAKKIFSWIPVYQSLQEGERMVWIDADISLKKRITKTLLDDIVGDFDIVFLDRDFPWYSAETGFFVLRKCPTVDQFVHLVLLTYMTGFLFDLAEWHDGYVFKTLLKLSANPNMKILNLNATPRERDVFERTMLADLMTHYKGSRKKEFQTNGQDDGMSTLIEYDPENQ